MTTTLSDVSIGQLRPLHHGKVREVSPIGDDRLLLVATDRLSAFDSVLASAIPAKGAVLNSLAAWWFEQTVDLVPNHLVRSVDLQASLVRRAEPVKIEVIVRGYITGSMGRRYLLHKHSEALAHPHSRATEPGAFIAVAGLWGQA